ncbi:hypothetical protein QBC39DRAFT_187704 [Podospora conica]|nr:hypothetical protein QBC39DRAFT_187704 [Schizothecium conicum]
MYYLFIFLSGEILAPCFAGRLSSLKPPPPGRVSGMGLTGGTSEYEANAGIEGACLPVDRGVLFRLWVCLHYGVLLGVRGG